MQSSAELSLTSDGELVAEEPVNYCIGLVALHAGYHIEASKLYTSMISGGNNLRQKERKFPQNSNGYKLP